MSKHLLTSITANSFEEQLKAIYDYFDELEARLIVEAKTKARAQAERKGLSFSEEDQITIEVSEETIADDLEQFFTSDEYSYLLTDSKTRERAVKFADIHKYFDADTENYVSKEEKLSSEENTLYLKACRAFKFTGTIIAYFAVAHSLNKLKISANETISTWDSEIRRNEICNFDENFHPSNSSSIELKDFFTAKECAFLLTDSKTKERATKLAELKKRSAADIENYSSKEILSPEDKAALDKARTIFTFAETAINSFVITHSLSKINYASKDIIRAWDKKNSKYYNDNGQFQPSLIPAEKKDGILAKKKIVDDHNKAISDFMTQIEQEADLRILNRVVDNLVFKSAQEDMGTAFTREQYNAFVNPEPTTVRAHMSASTTVDILSKGAKDGLIKRKNQLLKTSTMFQNKLKELQAHLETAENIIKSKQSVLIQLKAPGYKAKLTAISNILSNNKENLPTFSDVKLHIEKTLIKSKQYPLTKKDFDDVLDQYEGLTDNVLDNVNAIEANDQNRWFGARLKKWVSDGFKKFIGRGMLSTDKQVYKAYSSVFAFYKMTEKKCGAELKNQDENDAIIRLGLKNFAKTKRSF